MKLAHLEKTNDFIKLKPHIIHIKIAMADNKKPNYHILESTDAGKVSNVVAKLNKKVGDAKAVDFYDITFSFDYIGKDGKNRRVDNAIISIKLMKYALGVVREPHSENPTIKFTIKKSAKTQKGDPIGELMYAFTMAYKKEAERILATDPAANKRSKGIINCQLLTEYIENGETIELPEDDRIMYISFDFEKDKSGFIPNGRIKTDKSVKMIVNKPVVDKDGKEMTVNDVVDAHFEGEPYCYSNFAKILKPGFEISCFIRPTVSNSNMGGLSMKMMAFKGIFINTTTGNSVQNYTNEDMEEIIGSNRANTSSNDPIDLDDQ
jgi:hypothetical protein